MKELQSTTNEERQDLEGLCQAYVESGWKLPFNINDTPTSEQQQLESSLLKKFHEKNQRFLEKIEKKRAKGTLGFQTTFYDLNPRDLHHHPQITQFYRKRNLKPIEDDDWSGDDKAIHDKHPEEIEKQSSLSKIYEDKALPRTNDKKKSRRKKKKSESKKHRRTHREDVPDTIKVIEDGGLSKGKSSKKVSYRSSKSASQQRIQAREQRKQRGKKHMDRFLKELEQERENVFASWRKEYNNIYSNGPDIQKGTKSVKQCTIKQLDEGKGFHAPKKLLEDDVEKQDAFLEEWKSVLSDSVSTSSYDGLDGKKHFTEEEEQKFMGRFVKELESEREEFLSVWKKELDTHYKREATLGFDLESGKKCFTSCIDSFLNCFAIAEVFISNIPLTIGAVGLSWIMQGVVWFKFMEQNLDACTPVHIDSPQCSFPEFSGCYSCDTTHPTYRAVWTFHGFCQIVAAICCLLVVLKAILSWEIFRDELSNPTTSTPLGVVFITVVCVAAGHGFTGEVIVILFSCMHFMLAFWFLRMAICKYRLWPDPGWYPNTVGLCCAATKTWLYFPDAGKVLMTLCMTLFFGIFFISLIRVVMNYKIASPVCFILLAAPSITLYAMTVIARPTRPREDLVGNFSDVMLNFKEINWRLYIPMQHFMMILSLIAMIVVLQSLYVRWPKLLRTEFGPAHFAFVFPLLCHANAVQAYRLDTTWFANVYAGFIFQKALFCYWFICLVVGTVLNLVFTKKFIMRLHRWTKVEGTVEDQESTSQSDPFINDLFYKHNLYESFGEPLVSPAVLQANETGILVRVRQDLQHEGRFVDVRTRDVVCLGFDPTMTEVELCLERQALLKWVDSHELVNEELIGEREQLLDWVASDSFADPDHEYIYGSFQGRGHRGVAEV